MLIKKCPICNKGHQIKKGNVCSSCTNTSKKIKAKIYFANLLGGKCKNCGLTDILCLEFHHKDPKLKKFTISDRINVKNLKSITHEDTLEELKKCELLCANCHLKFHCNSFQKVLEYFDREIDNTKKRKSIKKYRPKMNGRKVERPSKEELEKLVWLKPSKQIGKELGVTGCVIEEWCKCYEISKPPRGYWQKKQSNINKVKEKCELSTSGQLILPT